MGGSLDVPRDFQKKCVLLRTHEGIRGLRHIVIA